MVANLGQIGDRWSNLESGILALIRGFESETGCRVDSVDLKKVNLMSGNSPIIGVSVEVSVPRSDGRVIEHPSRIHSLPDRKGGSDEPDALIHAMELESVRMTSGRWTALNGRIRVTWGNDLISPSFSVTNLYAILHEASDAKLLSGYRLQERAFKVVFPMLPPPEKSDLYFDPRRPKNNDLPDEFDFELTVNAEKFDALVEFLKDRFSIVINKE